MVESRHPEEESIQNKAWCWNSMPSSGDNVPSQRSLHSGIVFGNYLYIFGGYDGIQRTNDFYKFNFTSMKWNIVLTNDITPSPRDRHISVVYGRSIYIYGGYDGFNRVEDFFEYNVDTNR